VSGNELVTVFCGFAESGVTKVNFLVDVADVAAAAGEDEEDEGPAAEVGDVGTDPLLFRICAIETGNALTSALRKRGRC
jgi:hypothetical protein